MTTNVAQATPEFRRVISGVVGFVWITWDAVLGQNADNQRHLMKTSQGQALPMRVKEIKEKTVVVDLNNPLREDADFRRESYRHQTAERK